MRLTKPKLIPTLAIASGVLFVAVPILSTLTYTHPRWQSWTNSERTTEYSLTLGEGYLWFKRKTALRPVPPDQEVMYQNVTTHNAPGLHISRSQIALSPSPESFNRGHPQLLIGTYGNVDSGRIHLLWFCAVAVIFPAWLIIRNVLRASFSFKRHRPGLCPSCGYDLRSTPEKCPECGKQPAHASSAPR